MTHQLQKTNWIILGCVAMVFGVQGCSTLNLPKTAFSKNTREYQGFDSAFDGGQTSVSEKVYNAVRQARAENSVVLHVIGDENPARVLPLPVGQKSVYVSELLTQTGVLEKLGRVNATLFRNSTDSIGGIPMEVRMDENNTIVRPESDYALQAGDRLMVSEATAKPMDILVKEILGL